MNDLERLARALSLALYREEVGDREITPPHVLDDDLVLTYIDQGITDLRYCVLVVLQELREPSHGALEAGRQAGDQCITTWHCAGAEDSPCNAYAEFDGAKDVLEAMLDHIIAQGAER